MKHIGFLSFGHWTPSPQSQTRSASDALLQSIELAVAAEELGADGAYFRVHHFARQLASPFPLLAACGAKLAKGCTSGQALTGGSILNVGSLLFMLAVFAAAFGVAYFVRKEWL